MALLICRSTKGKVAAATHAKPTVRKTTDESLTVQQRFGINVRAGRLANKLTREVVASRVGMAKATLSDIEGGRQDVTLGVMDRIATAIGWPLSTLLAD